MNLQDQVTLGLTTLGALIIFMSKIGTWRILKMLGNGKYTPFWRILFVLMIVFFIGYLGAAYMIYAGYSAKVFHYAGLIFFLGSLFVYLVVYTGHLSIQELKDEIDAKVRYQSELHDYKDRLEETVEKRTIALENEIQERKKYEAELQESYELVQRDVQLAADFQKAVLPEIESTDFVRIAKRFIPEDVVSGDIYNVVQTSEGNLNVFLADVTGHGIASALMTMMMQVGLDVLYESVKPAVVLHEMNLLVAHRDTDKSATGVCFSITPDGKMNVAHAGHPPMIIIPADGSNIVVFQEGGCPLGMFEETPIPYVEESYTLKKGDKIMVYSDGITEWQNKAGELFGMSRLLAFIEKNRSSDIYKLIEDLMMNLDKFSHGEKCDGCRDDLTCLLLEYTGKHEN